uniref:7TM GPCR serpentine receptor class x (Srx) domain-containing protein n=1 Tax=Panagrolaimus davidi TaxID=227884 RepID=A0A914PT10_9BILA
MLASFHLVWRFDTNPWHVFLSTSIAWELCHALDAILMIAFNAKLRKHSPGVSKIPSMKSVATRSVGDFPATVRIVS